MFLVRVNFELYPKKWTKITFHKVYYQNLCISSIYILFNEICFCFVLDLYFFFSFLLARKKRKRSNQEKEKSRAFFCATIIVAIKQQRLAFIIFIKFALRTVTLGLRRMFEEFLLKNSEFTHALMTYLYVLTSD